MKKLPIKRKIKKWILGYDVHTYYFAQGGEDAILRSIFQKKISKKEKGFFVDVGAYHPYNFSNTFLFYQSGWSGINIDACPGSMDLFNRIRPRDTNLEIGIGEKEQVLNYYFVDKNSTINSFSRRFLEKNELFHLVTKTIPVKVYRLEDVLDKYVPPSKRIDFINIDVEGIDLEVLKSNNWEKYHPTVLVIELEGEYWEDLISHPTAIFLRKKGYKIIAKNVLKKGLSSTFFIEENFKDY